MTKILVLARSVAQVEEWRLSMGLPRGVATDVITSRATRDHQTEPVLVRLPGWDMRSYREVAPVVAELNRLALVELPCNDPARFQSWRGRPVGAATAAVVADASRGGQA
jgi:hypothetical protein